MANGQSVLAKKIHAAKSKASPSSDLGEFALALQIAVQKAASALLDAECQAKSSATTGALQSILNGAADPGIYYWLSDSSGEPALLITVEPGFAGAMTTRLLGGELAVAAGAGASATAVDFEMSASLVETLAPPLNTLLQKASSAAPRISGLARRSVRALKEALRDQEKLATFAFAIDLDIDGKVAPKAITLVFADSFLRRAGLVATGATQTHQAAEDWSAALRRNILNIEIPLAVVLDRFATNVGALSRLQVGQIIDIDKNALGRLDIAATTVAGPATVARGRLGSWQAQKAVKLTTDIDQDFLRGL